MAIKKIITLSALSAALFLVSGCDNGITFNALLKEMGTRECLTYYPENDFHHRQFSSYNRKSVAPGQDGWFENFDMSHFLRVEENSGRREFVMFDADGPGAIVRWWMTFYKAQYGTLRIYLDHDTIPAIEGAPNEILSGKALADYPFAASVQDGAPIGEEGRDYDHNLYLPIPFSQHCKITYECDEIIKRFEFKGIPVENGYYWPDVFYNIGYRAYNENTRIKTFTTNALKKAAPLIERTGKTLMDGKKLSAIQKDFEKTLTAGDSLTISLNYIDHAVNHLSVRLEAEDVAQALRSTVLQIAFDDMTTVWVPAGEFFGSGYNLNTHKAWMNARDDNGLMESFWVMPFREKCVITFINYGSETVNITGAAGLDPYAWKENSMYFAASWHEYFHVKTRDDQGMPYLDLNFIDIQGKGVYVGDQVTLYNNSWMWWGEGDEKIFVDGEAFPSSFGTGTEDYYGYSFARQESFSHPFVAQPAGIGNMARGLTVNLRQRALDAIPFRSSISANMELWHWDTTCLNFALTSYYYIFAPFRQNIKPDVNSVKRKIATSRQDFNCD